LGWKTDNDHKGSYVKVCTTQSIISKVGH